MVAPVRRAGPGGGFGAGVVGRLPAAVVVVTEVVRAGLRGTSDLVRAGPGAVDSGVVVELGVGRSGGGRSGAAGSCHSLLDAGVVGSPPSCSAVIPTSSRPATAAQNTRVEPRW